MLDIDGATLASAHTALGSSQAALALPCDVADAEGVAKAVATIEKQFGRLDALVNNAGIATFKPLLDTTHAEWERVLAVNLTGPFLTVQAAAPRDEPQRRRCHRQHHVDLGIARLDLARRLWHEQSRA